MAPVDNRSPISGQPVPPHYVHASDCHFRLTDGRTILLRGINLAASAKTPRGQPGAKLEGFWESAKSGEMSFVGRVLELDEADEHLERLRRWGFNCLRFVTTWEQIEHAGPGKYDQDFLDYVVALLRKCREYGFRVYMDPHQDLWSRFSGGSGAPYWTLLACGLEPQNFTRTRAAVIECEWPDPASPDPSAFPPMIWATNYSRLACQTVFTMFFAGRDYAPKCIIDGVNIQDWLQSHYFNAYRKLGQAIAQAGDLLDETVIGWDSINEPNAGYLGVEDLGQHGKDSVLRVGPMPTGFQALRMGMGEKMEVENWMSGPLGPKRDGSVVVDPQGTVAWLSPEAEPNGKSPWGWQRDPGWKLGTCIWAQHGVWDVESKTLLKPDYFNVYRGDGGASGRHVEFGADYWLPHWRAWAPVVRSFHPEAIHFIHSPVFQVPPKIDGPEIQNRAAHSSHFYDGLTLVTKHWNWFNADAIGILRGKYPSVVFGVKVGEAAIRRCLRSQLGVLRQDCFDALGKFPTMMGEIGIPYDLDKKKAYKDGNYATQVRALDASLNACDGKNMLNYTVWNYCPDNSHEWGDKWNGEDLSVWSPDDAVQMVNARTAVGRRARALGNVNPGEGGIKAKRDSSRSSSGSSGTVTPLDDPLHPINLNDGSRALPAFVRPYPVKTVGTPVSLDFDIRSSKLTLEIRVDANDVADPDLPTEIYIPLAHYAAHPQKVSYHVKAASQAHHPGGAVRHAAAGNVSPNDLGKSSDEATDLAVKVKVSAGRYEVDRDAQVLKWYYPRPASGSMTVKLELQRDGGPIPLWVTQWYRSGSERAGLQEWNGNTCSLVGVTLLGAVGVAYTAVSFCRSW